MDRTQTSRHIITDVDQETNALLARNPWSTQFADQVVFLDLAGRQESWTGDRREFLGPHGTAELPAGRLRRAPALGRRRAGPGPVRRPAAADRARAGASAATCSWCWAPATTWRRCASWSPATGPSTRARCSTDVRRLWDRRLSAVQVKTPSSAFDVMMNGWLLYQTLACRMLARSGYYQASGAYGFRDQLQDSMTVALVEPALAREPPAAGRRTAVPRGRRAALVAAGHRRGRPHPDQRRRRLAGPRRLPVRAGHRRRRHPRRAGPVPRGRPARRGRSTRASSSRSVSNRSATLYDHCVLALQHAFRYGTPRTAADRHRRLERRHEPRRRRRRGRERVAGLVPARDARPSSASWRRARGDADFAAAVPPGAGDPGGRARGTRLGRRLVPARLLRRRHPAGLVARAPSAASTGSRRAGRCSPALPTRSARSRPWSRSTSSCAWPTRASSGCSRRPFDVSEPDPGYIRAYPPGVRENGGQYTHGALWSVFAWAALGREDRAAAIFQLINPVNHALTPQAAETVPGRALRGRRGCVLRGAARRTRWLDLVHRLGGVDVPRRAGGHPRAQAPRRRAGDRAVPAPGVDAGRRQLPVRRAPPTTSRSWPTATRPGRWHVSSSTARRSRDGRLHLIDSGGTRPVTVQMQSRRRGRR